MGLISRVSSRTYRKELKIIKMAGQKAKSASRAVKAGSNQHQKKKVRTSVHFKLPKTPKEAIICLTCSPALSCHSKILVLNSHTVKCDRVHDHRACQMGSITVANVELLNFLF